MRLYDRNRNEKKETSKFKNSSRNEMVEVDETDN